MIEIPKKIKKGINKTGNFLEKTSKKISLNNNNNLEFIPLEYRKKIIEINKTFNPKGLEILSKHETFSWEGVINILSKKKKFNFEKILPFYYENNFDFNLIVEIINANPDFDFESILIPIKEGVFDIFTIYSIIIKRPLFKFDGNNIYYLDSIFKKAFPYQDFSIFVEYIIDNVLIFNLEFLEDIILNPTFDPYDHIDIFFDNKKLNKTNLELIKGNYHINIYELKNFITTYPIFIEKISGLTENKTFSFKTIGRLIDIDPHFDISLLQKVSKNKGFEYRFINEILDIYEQEGYIITNEKIKEILEFFGGLKSSEYLFIHFQYFKNILLEKIYQQRYPEKKKFFIRGNFNPEIEIQKIKKSKKNIKQQNIDFFKKQIFDNKQLVAQIIKKVQDIIEYDENHDLDQIVELIKDKFIKLPLDQRIKIFNQLKLYTDKVRKIQFSTEIYKNNGIKILERVFKLPTDSFTGEVFVKRLGDNFCFYVENDEDYEQLGGDNDSEGFFWGFGEIENIQQSFIVIRHKNPFCVVHEYRHGINRHIFSDYQKDYLAIAKDEIIAYMISGSKKEYIWKTLSDPKGSYNYMISMYRKHPTYYKKIRKEYRINLKTALEIAFEFREKHPNNFLDILSITPIQEWHKLI